MVLTSRWMQKAREGRFIDVPSAAARGKLRGEAQESYYKLRTVEGPWPLEAPARAVDNGLRSGPR